MNNNNLHAKRSMQIKFMGAPHSPHILIFEPESNGHQMEHIRYLLNDIEAKVANVRVTLLTTSEAAEHPNCRRLIDDFRHFVTPVIAPPVTGGNRFYRLLGVFYEHQWRNAQSLARGIDDIGANGVDFVLIPHLECVGLLQLGPRPAVTRGRPWATIALSIRFHHRRRGIEGPFRWLDFLQAFFFYRIIRRRSLVCFGSVNPYLSSFVRDPKVAYCPEPSPVPARYGAEAARAAYGVRPDTCVVLVAGVIDRRKCLDVLYEGAARVIPELDLTVLVAGPQHTRHLAAAQSSEAARKLRKHGRLIEVNRFILSGVDIDPMSVADIVWVFYEPEFVNNSNVLVRSGLSRRPVIVRRRGVIGRQVEDHQIGVALSSDAPDVVAAALSKLARDPELRRTLGENGAKAFADNTPEVFSRPIVDAINRTTRVKNEITA
jgi:glycosyltransferase involved in cell wall biosynthesis